MFHCQTAPRSSQRTCRNCGNKLETHCKSSLLGELWLWSTVWIKNFTRTSCNTYICLPWTTTLGTALISVNNVMYQHLDSIKDTTRPCNFPTPSKINVAAIMFTEIRGHHECEILLFAHVNMPGFQSCTMSSHNHWRNNTYKCHVIGCALF